MRILTLKKRLLYIVTFLLVLLSLIIPEAVNANMANPWQGEHLIGEPTGDFRNLGIVWEKLNFDLRPLNDFGESTVTAIYQIRNDGEQIPVELLFVSPGIKTGKVTLDGKTIAAETVKNPKLPPNWEPPSRVPTSGGGSIRYFVNKSINSALKFKPTIPQGEHQIQVKYVVAPSSYDYSIYKDYQVVYILAPAKNWAFFKRLDVEIKIPENWKVTTSLPMKRTGNILKANFNKIPADNLAISTSPHLTWYVSSIISLTPVVFYISGVIAAIWVGKAIPRSTDELKVRLIKALFLAIPLGIIAFLALAITGLYLREGLSNLLLQKIHLANTNGSAYAILFFLFIGLFISGFIAFISAMLLARKRI
ncbi:hypothetical protein NIES267_14390 [Calothrix parasitica NIES-267]|uniref:Uncharacterized protein n=1 Tax=Calothrix parasitica NIES-267 TaxID=1973488 RepID=A0A1Z4LL41_9CYAN|nr:hypothetical protein NIES267_14390 [Calothrix parasitica NIES-267]